MDRVSTHPFVIIPPGKFYPCGDAFTSTELKKGTQRMDDDGDDDEDEEDEEEGMMTRDEEDEEEGREGCG